MKKSYSLILLVLLIILTGCFHSIDDHFNVVFNEGTYSNDEVVTLNDSNVNSVTLVLDEISKEEYDSKNGLNVLREYSTSPDKYFSITFIFDFEDESMEVLDLTFKGWDANIMNGYAFEGTMNLGSEINKRVHITLYAFDDIHKIFQYLEIGFYVYGIESTDYTFHTRLFLQTEE